MNVLEVIKDRRSIRKFKADPIPDELLKSILKAASQAPSGHNRQPWHFVVVTKEKRAEMIQVMRDGIAARKAKGEDVGSSEWTTNAMETAAVTVFVFNPGGLHPWQTRSVEQVFRDVVDIQSIGAAIQNMALAAQGLGVGSLWICDVFEVYENLLTWLGEKDQMIAAMSFGYADEAPGPRPRKSLSEITRWM